MWRQFAALVTGLTRDRFIRVLVQITLIIFIARFLTTSFYLYLLTHELDRHFKEFAVENISDLKRRNRFVNRSATIVYKTLLQNLDPEDISAITIILVTSFGLAWLVLRPLKENQEAQKNFVASVSHEFRTPLTNIKTGLEVGLWEGKTISQHGTKWVLMRPQTLKSSLEEIDRMENITRQLIEFVHLDTSAFLFKKEPVDITYLIKSVVKQNISRARAEKKSLVMRTAGRYVVEGDEKQLFQAISIIIKNALDYTRAKGRISVMVEKHNGKVIITCADNGIGIPKEDIPKLFRPFQRGGGTQSYGFGLGLSITKRIIKKHGGSVSLTSVEGKGTTVKAVLPTRTS